MIFQIGRQVYAYEDHLKATDKITGHEHLKTAIAKGLAYRFQNTLLFCRGLGLYGGWFTQTPGQGRHEQSHCGQNK